jgi:hypothetical protein
MLRALLGVVHCGGTTQTAACVGLTSPAFLPLLCDGIDGGPISWYRTRRTRMGAILEFHCEDRVKVLQSELTRFIV